MSAPIGGSSRARRWWIAGVAVGAVLVLVGLATVLAIRRTPAPERSTAVLTIRSLDGVSPVSLDQPRQVLLTRIRAAGFGHPEVSVTGPDELTVSIDATDEPEDRLLALVNPAELRFRKVLNVVPDHNGSGPPPAPPGDNPPVGAATVLPPSIAEKLGAAAVRAADRLVASPPADLTTIGTDAAVMAALEPFGHLTANEVGQLPTAMQFLVPQVSCFTLARRPVASIMDVSRPVVACENGGPVKMLLDKASVTGSDIAGAKARPDQTGLWAIDLSFTTEGAARWSTLTSEAYDNTAGACRFTTPRTDGTTGVCEVAVVIDLMVVSAPAVQAPHLTAATLSGSFTSTTAQLLATQLSGGSLGVATQLKQVDWIHPRH